jgi:hypothetical protein
MTTSATRLMCFLSVALAGEAQESNPFDKAAKEREAARQRAFERGQRNELPAREKRENIGRLDSRTGAVLDEQCQPVNQGPPAAAVYNRVMETERHFKHHQDPYLWNVNDVFTDDPKVREKMEAEARRLYPDLQRQQSAFALRQAAINRWIDSRSPPLARDSRRMLLVAHMVSLELTGALRQDSFGIGQVPLKQMFGESRPLLLRHGSLEISVQGDQAGLPDGLVGKVTLGQEGRPDVIEWLDAEGAHKLMIPQSETGLASFSSGHQRPYTRLPGLGSSYRVRLEER